MEPQSTEGYSIIEIRVVSKKISALLDTGCEATLISENCYLELSGQNLLGRTLPVLGVSIKGVVGKDADKTEKNLIEFQYKGSRF